MNQHACEILILGACDYRRESLYVLDTITTGYIDPHELYYGEIKSFWALATNIGPPDRSRGYKA